jgi:2-methylcitrate dehydratase PrpD
MDAPRQDLQDKLKGLSEDLCRAAAATRYGNLPDDVIRVTKMLILDTLGIIGAAKDAPGMAALHARLSSWEPDGSATALLSKRKLSPPSAALANGAAAHALDFDDIHDEARVHTSSVILPVVLAVAEHQDDVSGREFIRAMALGAEIDARLGLTCFNCLGIGWHPTALLGVMAGAIAAGLLLKLDSEQLLGALGFAHHLANGSAQSMLDGTLTKRLGPGFAAKSAVMAAYLSGDGLSGPRRALEGQAGLFLLQQRGEVIPERLLEGFGKRWDIRDYGFKAFPSCRCTHSTIDLGLQMHRRGLQPNEIGAIEIAMPQVNFKTVGQPYDPQRKSMVHAQFSAAYCFARALTDGRVDLTTFAPDALVDPRIAALTKCTRVVPDPDMDPIAMGPVRVQLTLRDGRTLAADTTKLLGGPEAPLSEEIMLDKFRSCLKVGLNADRAAADRLAETVLQLERASNSAILAQVFPAAVAD